MTDQAKEIGGATGIGLAVGAGLDLVSGTMLDQIGLGIAFGPLFGSVAEQSRMNAVPEE